MGYLYLFTVTKSVGVDASGCEQLAQKSLRSRALAEDRNPDLLIATVSPTPCPCPGCCLLGLY